MKNFKNFISESGIGTAHQNQAIDNNTNSENNTNSDDNSNEGVHYLTTNSNNNTNTNINTNSNSITRYED